MSCATSNKIPKKRSTYRPTTKINATTVSENSSPSQRNEIITLAESRLGSPYKYASKGPKSYDCSGLVCAVYEDVGSKICAPSYELAKKGSNIPIEKARPGDLVFFSSNGKVFHVSIIVGTGDNELWVIHSTTSRGVIKENILASVYWKPKLYKIISYDQLN